jgi:hypothetical protein
MRASILLALGIAVLAIGYLSREWHSGKHVARLSVTNNAELKYLHEQDQSDRSPALGKTEDWNAIVTRDQMRRERVKALFRAGRIRTADDYYHAAMVLQHGDKPEDFLLAHEFCVAAIVEGKNDKESRWLGASAEDRLLMALDRPQRFGTQFRSDGDDPTMHLYEVDDGLTDDFRRLMDTDSLGSARAHETELRKRVAPAAVLYSSADSGVAPPVAVKRQMPEWPPQPATERERHGQVELRINEKGEVVYATLRRATIDAYDRAFMANLQSWRFKPAIRDGQAVRYRLLVDVEVPR